MSTRMEHRPDTRCIQVMVPMRDGIRLATDIHLPAGMAPDSGPARPVILERTPYGKRLDYRTERTREDPTPIPRAAIAAWFVERGYIVVYQDCRGRFGSEGTFTKYLGEGQDGFDTLEWLARQPFCDGRIATMGLSYAAHTQAAAACLGPESLACMLLDSGGFSSAYQGGIRQGGALELKQATWAFKHARLSPQAQADPAIAAALDAEDIRTWFEPSRMPWRRGQSPIRWVPEYEDYLFEQWERMDFDDYWRQVGLYAEGYHEHFPDVPVLHMSSWYDPYSRTATDNFSGLCAAGKRGQRLVLGPWLHGQRSITHAGEVDFGRAATLDGNLADNYLEFRRAWFDRWMFDRHPEEDPVVRYFLMGGGSGRPDAKGRFQHRGRWCQAGTWPPEGVVDERWFLHADHGLRKEAPTTSRANMSWTHDPLDPVPSLGGTVTSGAPVMEGGAFDQSVLDRRGDILRFVSEPLEEDVEFSGAPVFELWVASDAEDTDITVKVIDWYPPDDTYPDGFALNVTDGILRLRYRDDWERPSMLKPGEPVKVRIQPFPTSNLFRAGHRIRVDIAASKYPHFDLNPLMKRTRNTLFLETSRPSSVLLPLRRR